MHVFSLNVISGKVSGHLGLESDSLAISEITKCILENKAKQIIVIKDTNKMPYLHVSLIYISSMNVLMQAVMLHMIRQLYMQTRTQ